MSLKQIPFYALARNHYCIRATTGIIPNIGGDCREFPSTADASILYQRPLSPYASKGYVSTILCTLEFYDI